MSTLFRRVRRGAARALGPALSGWALLGMVGVVTAPALAHDFWLDLVTFTPKPGEEVPVVYRIGQSFLGDSYPFEKSLSKRFALIDARGERAIKAIRGDDPAADVRFGEAGLAIVVCHRDFEQVRFETWEQFEFNLKEEGLEAIVAKHRAAKKPEKGVRELYSRSAKALARVGGNGGLDRVVGLPIEIVAEHDPDDLPLGASLAVRVLFEGKPLAGALVKLHNRNDAQSPRTMRSDAEGRARLEIAGHGEYMVAAVHMLEPPAKLRSRADWISHWASLTFARRQP